MLDYKALEAAVDSLSDKIVDYARQLIRYPSLSGRELEAQRYLASVMDSLGADVIDLWEPDFASLSQHPAFVSSRSSFAGSPNLAGLWRGGGQGRSLILSSHIDIVPEGDSEAWSLAPFGGHIADGKIYGRGVSDMKGSLAAMFGAMEAIKASGLRLAGDLSIISTIEEETGSAGALAAALRGYRADAAIIPEPTGFAVCPAQQGGARFRITVRGRSAHGGQRYLGVSAVEKADLVRRGLAKYEAYLNEKFQSEFYRHLAMPFTINIGLFQSGEWFCTVPQSAYMEGRLAVPPGLSVARSLDNLKRFIELETADDPWFKEYPVEVDIFGSYWEPAQMPSAHPLIELAAAAVERIRGQAAQVCGTSWGTDGRMFSEFAQTPSLVFGPGTSAHCPDEFLPVGDLIQYTKILAGLIVQWCGLVK